MANTKAPLGVSVQSCPGGFRAGWASPGASLAPASKVSWVGDIGFPLFAAMPSACADKRRGQEQRRQRRRCNFASHPHPQGTQLTSPAAAAPVP